MQDSLSMVKENIFTVGISIGSYRRFIREVFYLAARRYSSYVCFANVHMAIEAYRNNDFNSVVNNADLIAPDGQPLALFLKYFKHINQERVCGMDLFPDLLKEAAARGKSIYLYGTTEEVLKKIIEKARRQFPSINICGHYSPPFRILTNEEKKKIVNQINEAQPDLIFVSLGCPKQEAWMAEHKDKIHGCMLGLGQAFHIYAETAKRSPMWMQRYSLEWAYRLYQEPSRLWKRYVFTNTYFLLLTFKYLVQTRVTNLATHGIKNLASLRNGVGRSPLNKK